MDFRRQLASIRKSEKVSQRELAQRIGVLRESIARFETYGSGMNYDKLTKYIKALGYRVVLIKEEYIKRDHNDLDQV